jgi:hypothetical protein
VIVAESSWLRGWPRTGAKASGRGKMHAVAASGLRREHGGRILSEWLEPYASVY